MRPLVEPTAVLRSGSPERLAEDLDQLLAQGIESWVSDPRDLMVAFAPYHDCTRRLGLRPADMFDEVAVRGPEPVREVVRTFGRREDITPERFGFAVVETVDGPEYLSAL